MELVEKRISDGSVLQPIRKWIGWSELSNRGGYR